LTFSLPELILKPIRTLEVIALGRPFDKGTILPLKQGEEVPPTEKMHYVDVPLGPRPKHGDLCRSLCGKEVKFELYAGDLTKVSRTTDVCGDCQSLHLRTPAFPGTRRHLVGKKPQS
jgi:hypothetical protein